MNAKALFAAKLKEFEDHLTKCFRKNRGIEDSGIFEASTDQKAIIFAACIIVEGIRNEIMDETK